MLDSLKRYSVRYLNSLLFTRLFRRGWKGAWSLRRRALSNSCLLARLFRHDIVVLSVASDARAAWIGRLQGVRILRAGRGSSGVAGERHWTRLSRIMVGRRWPGARVSSTQWICYWIAMSSLLGRSWYTLLVYSYIV